MHRREGQMRREIGPRPRQGNERQGLSFRHFAQGNPLFTAMAELGLIFQRRTGVARGVAS
jgi:hypothetical protein